MYKSFITAAFVALSSLQSYAQEELMSLKFITFPMTMEPMKVELLLSEGRTMELLVPSNELSPTIRVPRMASLVFGKTTINEEQKTEFKIYGQGKPTTGPNQLVLLIRKGKEMSSGFEVRAISSDINEFAGGKLLFVNATKVDIAGDVGKIPFTLKPAIHRIIKPKLEENGRLAEVKFWYNKDGEAVPFFNSMWPVSDEYRGLIFFYHDPNNDNKIQIHSFRDFLGEE
jgi:hypothetical protein